MAWPVTARSVPSHLVLTQPAVKVQFKAISGAPPLQRKVFQVSASNRFETVVSFLRKKLGVRHEDSVVCYINQVFAPGLDETVGGLFNVGRPLLQFAVLPVLTWLWNPQCFSTGSGAEQQLTVYYAMTPAFG